MTDSLQMLVDACRCLQTCRREGAPDNRTGDRCYFIHSFVLTCWLWGNGVLVCASAAMAVLFFGVVLRTVEHQQSLFFIVASVLRTEAPKIHFPRSLHEALDFFFFTYILSTYCCLCPTCFSSSLPFVTQVRGHIACTPLEY